MRSINKLEHMHVYQINNMSVVEHYSHITYMNIVKTVIKYIH